MLAVIVVDVRGIAAATKALDALDGRGRQNLERRGVRAAGNVFKPALAAAARAHHGGSSNVPSSFAKVRVRVSASLRRGQATAIVRPTSPLFNIFEPGARAHEIVPHGNSLAGPAGPGSWSKEGRKRATGFYARGPVHHPGMSARPLLPAVFAANEPAAVDAFANVVFGHSLGSAGG